MSSKWELKKEYKNIFIQESLEQIQEWEESLLELEKAPANGERIDRLFRAVHTLKGSAGFVGFSQLQELCHNLENVLQKVRDGNVDLTSEMIELLFRGLDVSRGIIDDFVDGRDSKEIIKQFYCALERFQSLKNDVGEESPLKDKVHSPLNKNIEVRDQGEDSCVFKVEIEIESQGQEAYLRAILIQHKLEEIGKIITVNPPLEQLKKSGGEFRYTVMLQTEKNSENVKKSLNIDLVKIISVEKIERQNNQITDSTLVNNNISKRKKEIKNTKNEFQQKKNFGGKVLKNEELVRVPVGKLDVILNLVGELVVNNSGFISITGMLRERFGRTVLIQELEEKTESLAKLVRDLQDATMKVRMLPVRSMFDRFTRVVRDLARDNGKQIDFEIYGEETEVDKKVMDKINEPLVHLVRNAVDHGIESKEERVKYGKDTVGHIRLGAYQEGDHICIEVSDDGKGLDCEAIKRKAVEKGVLKKEEAEALSDEEVFKLIFLPGFSTAEKVSDISGRGVGLDVVKSTVEEMGGDIRVRTKRGEGTVITIILPLTMAIIPAILVEVEKSIYAVPLSSVREVVKVKKQELIAIGKNTVLKLRDEIIAIVLLKDILEIGSNNGKGGFSDEEISIVVVDYVGKKIGIVVEKLLGNEEIVIKSLSKHYREIEGLAGASILGNGQIALILDIEPLVRKYFKVENHFKFRTVDINIRGNEEVRNEKHKKQIEKVYHGKEIVKKTLDLKTTAKETELLKNQSYVEEVTSNHGKNDNEIQLEDETRIIETKSFLMELDRDRKEILEEIHANGAINASISMTQFMGKDIRVSFPETKIIRLSEVSNELGGDEVPVSGIFVPIHGDLIGGMLIIIPMDQVFIFSDMLFHREPGTTKKITEEENSGLLEMGNILSASFINAMANSIGFRVRQDVPEMSIDMCLSVLDSVLIHFNQPGDSIILTQAELYFSNTEQAICYMLLFLEPESLIKLGDVLKEATLEENIRSKDVI